METLVDFRMWGSADWGAQIRNVLRAASRLLHEFPGDAVLLYNGERVILVRHGTELTVNSAAEPEEDYLSELTLPYQRSPIPDL